VSGWIATRIISKETHETRVHVLESFIELGQELLNLRNYSGAMTVLSSLNSSAVARLKQTWEASILIFNVNPGH
jgi:hypothetical protein